MRRLFQPTSALFQSALVLLRVWTGARSLLLEERKGNVVRHIQEV
jgi:hypothetical protein